MEPAGSDIGAIEETVVFLDYFKELPDPRQAGKVIYPLAEVLLLCLLAVLAGAESFVDIARFGEKKIKFLRRFRPRGKEIDYQAKTVTRAGRCYIVCRNHQEAETEIEYNGKRFIVRSAPRPAASLALRAAGVALPPTVRDATAS